MPLSSLIKHTEALLEQVLQSIREEYERPYSMLSETDRNRFVEEEESLRKQLKEVGSESGNWRSLLCLPSPQLTKCHKDAETLLLRVKEDINAKLRTTLTGRRNPALLSSRGQDSAMNLMGARTPGAATGQPPTGANPRPTSAVITSPLNMRCSLTEPSELIVYPAVQNGNDYTSDLSDAINSPLETSGAQSRASPSPPRRRSAPPPPRRRTVQPSNLRLSSETTGSSGSDSPGRSRSVRRPAPPPPQSTGRSGTPSSPINGSFSLRGPSSPNPAVISSIPALAQQMEKLASSIVKESLSRQAQGRRGLGCSEDYITKTNCVDINDSNVDGLTFHNGGTNNSGSVIHKTTLPSHSRQPV